MQICFGHTSMHVECCVLALLSLRVAVGWALVMWDLRFYFQMKGVLSQQKGHLRGWLEHGLLSLYLDAVVIKSFKTFWHWDSPTLTVHTGTHQHGINMNWILQKTLYIWQKKKLRLKDIFKLSGVGGPLGTWCLRLFQWVPLGIFCLFGIK